MRFWIFILLTWTLTGCSQQTNDETAKDSLKTVSVNVQSVQSKQAPHFEEFAGTLVSVHRANLATRLSGWITYLEVEEGDAVEMGDVLVRIDSADISAQAAQAEAGVRQAQAQVNQALASSQAAQAAIAEAHANLATTRAMMPEAKAQLDLAQAEFERMEMLHKEGALSDQDYDRARTNLTVAKTKIEQLKFGVHQAQAAVSRAKSGAGVAQAAVGSAQAGTSQAQAAERAALTPLQYASVTAPFSGYVVKKLANAGEMAGPGQVLLTIEDTQRLRLEIPVPEARLSHFPRDGRLNVHFDAVKGEFTGLIDQIVPSGDSSSRTFLVKIEIHNPERKLLPGMYGRVQVEQGSQKSLRVPASAVVKRGELEGLFLVGSDNRAEYRLVKLGTKQDDSYQVLTGLQDSAEVILNPPPELRSGSPLEIRK